MHGDSGEVSSIFRQARNGINTLMNKRYFYWETKGFVNLTIISKINVDTIFFYWFDH